jgi:hypothetical protein
MPAPGPAGPDLSSILISPLSNGKAAFEKPLNHWLASRHEWVVRYV